MATPNDEAVDSLSKPSYKDATVGLKETAKLLCLAVKNPRLPGCLCSCLEKYPDNICLKIICHNDLKHLVLDWSCCSLSVTRNFTFIENTKMVDT